MREGKLYTFILGNSELSPSLKAVFKAWLDSAAEEFPDLAVVEFHDWFSKYFGQTCSDTLTEEKKND